MSTAPRPDGDAPRLIADIGGTNARFALVDAGGAVIASERVPTADHPGPVEAARAVIARHAPHAPPARAAWAVACPVLADTVNLTNADWCFSIESARRALGLDDLAVVNDFAANALAIPDLAAADCAVVGPDLPGRVGAPIAALGPGTGLGVALLLPGAAGGWQVLPTEGGHVTLAAADAEEAHVIARLWKDHAHVSAERLVSGPGLLLLYETLRALDGGGDGGGSGGPAPDDPAAVTAAARTGDPLAARAVAMMFAMLGTVAGNLVLTTGTLGGVHILGGIVPAHLPLFRASPFRARFEAKGRFRDYLATVPTRVVLHPNPAFPGLLRLLHDRAGAA